MSDRVPHAAPELYGVASKVPNNPHQVEHHRSSSDFFKPRFQSELHENGKIETCPDLLQVRAE